jgi:hypothetical protein
LQGSAFLREHQRQLELARAAAVDEHMRRWRDEAAVSALVNADDRPDNEQQAHDEKMEIA